MNTHDVAIDRVALAQHGLITAADAARLGISPRSVKRRVAVGQWQRLAKGVWRLTHLPDTWVQRLAAAQWSLGPQAVISHRSAAALLGFEGPGPHQFGAHGPVDVLVPWDLRGRRGPWTLHALGPRQPPLRSGDDVTVHGPTGLSITTPARTRGDLARWRTRWAGG